MPIPSLENWRAGIWSAIKTLTPPTKKNTSAFAKRMWPRRRTDGERAIESHGDGGKFKTPTPPNLWIEFPKWLILNILTLWISSSFDIQQGADNYRTTLHWWHHQWKNPSRNVAPFFSESCIFWVTLHLHHWSTKKNVSSFKWKRFFGGTRRSRHICTAGLAGIHLGPETDHPGDWIDLIDHRAQLPTSIRSSPNSENLWSAPPAVTSMHCCLSAHTLQLSESAPCHGLLGRDCSGSSIRWFDLPFVVAESSMLILTICPTSIFTRPTFESLFAFRSSNSRPWKRPWTGPGKSKEVFQV